MEAYLQQNPIFESFSSLTRVALLTFISEKMNVSLLSVAESGGRRPSFLWDYDLTETQVHEILGTRGLPDQKRWLIERILTQARFEETLKYLTMKDIKTVFSALRLPKKVKERWQYALRRWSERE